MFIELERIMEQALSDPYATKIDGDDYVGRLVYGVKIIKFHNEYTITIYNTTKGGDYYEEINEEQYNVFLKKGWRKGVYKVCLDNYKNKLRKIERKIKEEINGRNSAKYIDHLKQTRTETMNRYYNITQKLNKYDTSRKTKPSL